MGGGSTWQTVGNIATIGLGLGPLLSSSGHKGMRKKRKDEIALSESKRQEHNANLKRGGYAPGSAVLPGTGGAGSGLIR